MLDTDPTAPESVKPDPETGRRGQRRTLWAVATLAALVMATASWQLNASSDAPTAIDAFNATADAAARQDRAASFTVTLREGGDFDLDQHLATDGRPVLLNLWASWCIPCRNEMPLLDDVAPTYSDVMFLGVAVNDTRNNAADFADEMSVTYPIAFDTDSVVLANYPAPAMPVTYVISSDGVVAGRYFGELDTDRIDELLAALR